jgi:hypothetical protein
MDIVRTDVLLWTLGGFAVPPREVINGTAMPASYIKEIKKLVERGGRIGNREAIDLGERFGHSPSSISTLVSTYRHRRPMPPYWREVT